MFFVSFLFVYVCVLHQLSLMFSVFLNVYVVLCLSVFVCFCVLDGFVLRQVCPGTVVSVIGSVNSQFRVNFSVNNQYLQTEQGGAP